MKNNLRHTEQPDVNKKAISLTAYRAIFLASILTQKDLSTEEIIQIFSNDKILSDSCHKDTVINTINSLREAGFEIEKPKPSNNFKYSLSSTPFKTELEEETSELLSIVRESLYYFNDYKLLCKINSAYDAILRYVKDSEYKNIIEASNHLKDINQDVFDAVADLCKDKAEAKIIYNSPQNGNEELKIKAQRIVYENNYLYLWLYNFKYQTPAYLRLDRIMSVKRLSSTSNGRDCMLSCPVEYELFGESAQKFIPRENEIVIEKLVDKITVRTNVINSFNFFQRIIGFGSECRILSPDSIKDAYLKRINRMLEKYE